MSSNRVKGDTWQHVEGGCAVRYASCVTFNNDYPKIEYSGIDFLQDTNTIRKLIFTFYMHIRTQ